MRRAFFEFSVEKVLCREFRPPKNEELGCLENIFFIEVLLFSPHTLMVPTHCFMIQKNKSQNTSDDIDSVHIIITRIVDDGGSGF